MWTFVNVYKSAYLTLVVVNLAHIYINWKVSHEPYVIAVMLLLANIISWFGLLFSMWWGSLGESILSVGRLLGILLSATFLADLIAWMSPVGTSVWLPLLRLSGSRSMWSWKNRLAWWSCCMVLFGLESIYLYCVTRLTNGVSSNADI